MDKPFTLVLQNGIKDVNAILAGLGELPAKASYHLIRNIETQWEAAQAQPEAPNETPAA